MADSPLYRKPLDPAEQPILDRLLDIRDHLSLLKQDRSTYVKSEDVTKYYDQLIEQVEAINRLRMHKREEQNRVDSVLDDCFQLISLFFLTIGRNREAPAVYSAISTVKRLLDHLKEAGFYSPKDLEGIRHNIASWEASIERGRDIHSQHLLTLLEARINVCKASLEELEGHLSRLEPHMMVFYEKLVSALRSLSALNTRSKFPNQEVDEWEQQVLQIRADLNEQGIEHPGQSAEKTFEEMLSQLSLTEGEPQDGKTVVRALLKRCVLWIEIMREKQGKIDERFQESYDKLSKLRKELEQMSLTQAWSLRETDLYAYQRQLDRIDESRINGNFLDAEGRPADLHAQRTLLYLLRKSYVSIYQYIVSSEPVSEALLPVYNQLVTLKRCLNEVRKSGGVDSPRELYPYSMKLSSIDNMTKDGKFMVGNDIPEGQASLTALMNECYDITHELRNEADARKDEKADSAHDQTDGLEVKS